MVKESACNAGDPDSILGSGRSPGERNGYPFQYSFVHDNSMDRGAWWSEVHGVTETDMTEQLTLYLPSLSPYNPNFRLKSGNKFEPTV